MPRLDLMRLQTILRHYRATGVMIAATFTVIGGDFRARHAGLFKGA